MTDIIDRAAELEEFYRLTALSRQHVKSRANTPSATECDNCGDPIPLARQKAVRGCRLCIFCQTNAEHIASNFRGG